MHFSRCAFQMLGCKGSASCKTDLILGVVCKKLEEQPYLAPPQPLLSDFCVPRASSI